MVNTRYPVSEEYKNSEFTYTEDEGAGLIGVLNGLILNTKQYRISANYNNNNNNNNDLNKLILIGFSLLENINEKFVKVE